MAGRSSVTVLSVAATALLAAVVFPLWKPLLLAAVLTGVLTRANERLGRAWGSRRTLAAALLTVSVVFVLLIPLSLLGLILVKQALSLIAYIRRSLSENDWHVLLAPLPRWLQRWAGPTLD